MSQPLLPQDRYIAEILGLTEEEMRWFKAEVQRRALEGPQPAVVAGIESVLLSVVINLVIGIGLTLVSSLLMPKPPTPKEMGRLSTRQRQGDTLQVPSAFAPTYGFDSVQDLAPLGDPIPLVYTRRELLDGEWYGGTRVNTPLLWSQIWSLGGSQMLRALFLVSEGEIESIHPTSFAIGNNTLGAYAFAGSAQRIAIYSVRDGGRIAKGNLLSGSTTDLGAQGGYGADIFQTDIGADNLQPMFCGAFKPNTSTVFGLYSPMANGLGYRINPRVRPLVSLQVKNAKYDAVDDAQAVAEAWKYKYCYSRKSGIVGTSKGSTPRSLVDLQVGDTFVYMLSHYSDAVYNGKKDPVIKVNEENSNIKGASQPGEESLVSVAQAVAGGQKQYDSALSEGELYKVGSCLAILIKRDPLFISESDYAGDLDESGIDISDEIYSGEGKGISAYYTFQVIRAGTVGVAGEDLVHRRFFKWIGQRVLKPALLSKTGGIRASRVWRFDTVGMDLEAGEIGERYYTASAFPQLYRCALGSIRLNRPTRYFEIGIRSNVAMQLQGLCNFGDIPDEVKVTTSTGTSGSVSTISLVAGKFNTTNDRTGLETRYYNSTTEIKTSYESGSKLGKGLTVRPVVSGTTIQSLTIVNPGSGYAVNDVVFITAFQPDMVVRFIYIKITALSAAGTDTTYTATVPGYYAVNHKAADALDGVSAEDNLTNTVFSSGSITAPERRYSFFRVSLRAGTASTDAFVETSNVIFGVSSASEAGVFNFLRFAMQGEAAWEVRIEPITSWELRNRPFQPFLLNSAGTSGPIQLGFSFGEVWAKGEFLDTRDFDELFDIQGLRPKEEIGLSWTEGTFGNRQDGTYLDRYARAAEFFVYDEVSTTCGSSPEHEITYVNVIQPNEAVPRYDNMCLVGINVRATQEWSQFSQLSAYITGGIKVDRLLGGFGASHLFPEILYDFLLNTRYGLGNGISPEQVDRASFTTAAQYCLTNRFFYDGPKLSSVNWRQWASDTAATHCLLLIERGGVLFLEPAIPEKPEIRGLFTAGNCISMELSSAEAEQRQPISVSVKYRKETYGGQPVINPSEPSYGLFPEPQERLIYHAQWGEGPAESIDMSDYCTSSRHANRAAKYIIGVRKLSDHTVKIQTTYEALTSSLAPGDFIKVALDYTHYNQFNNGAVTADGDLVSSTALTDGTYTVVYWTGDKDATVKEGQLVVSENGTKAMPAGVVFTVKTSEVITRTYRIDSLQPTEDGYQIEAIHTPLLPDGTLQLYAEWNDPSYWVTV